MPEINKGGEDADVSAVDIPNENESTKVNVEESAAVDQSMDSDMAGFL